MLQSGYLKGRNLEAIWELQTKQLRLGLDMVKLQHSLHGFGSALPLEAFSVAHLGEACIMLHVRHAKQLNTPTPPRLAFGLCCDALGEIQNHLPLGGPLLKVLSRKMAEACPDDGDEAADLVDAFSHLELESVMSACGRPTYSLPTAQLIARLDPALGEQWSFAWTRHRAGSVASLLNVE